MKKLGMIIFAVVVITLIDGCQNKYEKSGVSPLPQNRPSSWENDNYRNANN